jgi:hypothetical protein
MPRLRRLPLLLLLVLLFTVAPYAAGHAGTPEGAGVVVPGPTPARAAPFLTDVLSSVDRTVARLAADERRRLRVAREAEARRLRRSPRPEAVVRRAWLLRLTSRATYDDQRRVLARARRAGRRLAGLRGREQRAVLAIVDGLAADRILTADRLRPVLLTLSRNTAWWTRRGAPAVGRSIVRGHGPVTLRYVPGHGLVLHQLASWSQVTWLAGHCLRDRVHCPRRRLRAAVDEMMGLAVRRDGVVRAESYFRFGRARAPWISAMTQGSAIQALTRSSAVLHSASDRRRARAALGAFLRPAPQGVAVRASGGRHYVMYSTAPELRILNGHLRALTGVRDLALIGGSRQARRVFRRGERSARVLLARTDTGAWSRYADGGPEASLGYHRLVTGFLADLCDRRAGRRYCQASRRFARYVREPTRVSVRIARAPRARQANALRVWISKASTVQVTVRDVRGRTVLRRSVQLPRGSHRFPWTPSRRGAYRVQATASGPGAPPLARAAVQLTARPRR